MSETFNVMDRYFECEECKRNQPVTDVNGNDIVAPNKCLCGGMDFALHVAVRVRASQRLDYIPFIINRDGIKQIK